LITSVSLSLVSFIQPNRDINLRVKAVYVYKFAQYVDWPKEFKTGDFIIGVFGDDRLYDEMQGSYSNKMIGNQTIKIKKYTATADIEQCHILFIAEKNSDKIAELVKKYKSKSTLIVSEKDGKLKDGSVINFVMKDNKLKYEVSKTNATKHKLTVGQSLTSIADKVE
jgi:hypothetical protein